MDYSPLIRKVINAIQPYIQSKPINCKQLHNLSCQLAKGFELTGKSEKIDLTTVIEETLKILVHNESILGIAAPIVTNSSAENPLICIVFEAITSENPNQKSLSVFSAQLKRAIMNPDIIRMFPEIFHRKKRSSTKREEMNIVSTIHIELSTSIAYRHLASDLQIGLQKMLNFYSSVSENTAIESMKHLRTGLIRIFKELPECKAIEINECLEMGIRNKPEEIVRGIAKKMRWENNPSRPLQKNTRNRYAKDFIHVIIYKGGFAFPKHRMTNRDFRDVQKKEDQANDPFYDDDPPENLTKEAKNRLQKIESSERRESNPYNIIFETPTIGVSHSSNDFVLSDQRAIMTRYLSGLKYYGCLHINEISRILRELFGFLQTSYSKDFECAIITLSLLLTGRTLDWLLEIVVDNNLDLEKQSPQQKSIYSPKRDAILYPPLTFEDITQPPTFRPHLLRKVNSLWILPLPYQLISYWRLIAKSRKKGQRFFQISKKEVLEFIRLISRKLQQSTPAMPSITLGRIRGAFTYLAVKEEGLHLQIASIVSDQRTLVPHASLFYTTLEITRIASAYRSAINSFFSLMNKKFNFEFPLFPSRAAKLPEGLLLGSMYFPDIHILRQSMAKLITRIEYVQDYHTKHNLLTTYFIYTLCLICGLRVSEFSTIFRTQFDWYKASHETPIRLLHLPITKSSRFVFASRSIPIPAFLHPSLEELLKRSSDQKYAFYYFLDEEKRVVTGPRFASFVADLMISFPRLNLGRHLVSSFLVQHQIESSVIDTILGHTNPGEEPFNPYLPNNVYHRWKRYLNAIGGLIDSLGLKENLL